MTVKIVQDTDKQADIFRGNIKIGVQEVDRYEEHIVRIESRVKQEKLSLKSNNKRGKRKKVRLENDQEVEIDLSAVTGDAFPFLWVRVDPEFAWLRQIQMKMHHAIEDEPQALPVSMLAYEVSLLHAACCMLACGRCLRFTSASTASRAAGSVPPFGPRHVHVSSAVVLCSCYPRVSSWQSMP